MNGAQTLYTLDDLLFLMERLRDPERGCPWDLKQNYKSITPSTIEEAYEVVDAIERDDYLHLKEELGDLVFQAIFYSQLAKEDNRFTFADVIHSLVDKLLRRHPHVFPSGNLHEQETSPRLSETEVKQRWEEIKLAERKSKGEHGLLADVPVAMPALTRAAKLQKRAAQVGFDWLHPEEVMLKLREELGELEEALAAQNRQGIEEEFGDLLFTCVNLSRHLKLDAETALRAANAKFVKRFEYMEKSIAEAGQGAGALPPAELEIWWQRAKNQDG